MTLTAEFATRYVPHGIYDYEPLPPTWSASRAIRSGDTSCSNLCDWRIINLVVDGEQFSMLPRQARRLSRELDMNEAS